MIVALTVTYESTVWDPAWISGRTRRGSRRIRSMRGIECPQAEYAPTSFRHISCACDVAILIVRQGIFVGEFVSATTLVSRLHSGDGVIINATLLRTPLMRQVLAASSDLANLMSELSCRHFIHKTSPFARCSEHYSSSQMAQKQYNLYVPVRTRRHVTAL